MNALVFLPDRDTSGHDWSGAFRVEARRFAALHGLPASALVQIDVSQPFAQRRAPLLGALEPARELEALVLLCHGWSRGVQLGLSTRSVALLAEALRGRCRADLAVALYACSTGAGPEESGGAPGGEGGFADALRDVLLPLAPDCHVDAHTAVGHCTRNPYVRRFDATTALSFAAGSGGLSLGSGTGAWTMPTGNGAWTGATNATLTLTASGVSGNVTITGAATSRLDGGTVNVGTTSATIVNVARSGQSLGFYGATAVARHRSTGQTAGFTAGVGSSVLDDSTFTGGVGATAYTLGDVVKALKNVGLMAA